MKLKGSIFFNILNIFYILCMNTILLSVRNAVRTNRGLKKPNADEGLKENIGVKSHRFENEMKFNDYNMVAQMFSCYAQWSGH